ncbi:transposable element Tcb2 transposase [Trichonephila clavipes]|nr:transposable element Tcb2 transposase [Trichonephila clavipes]
MSLRRFRRQYEKLSQFEMRRIISMMEAGWTARRVGCHLGLSHCVVSGTSGSERHHLHENQAQDALDGPVVEKTNASDESRFIISSDDNRARVWIPRGEQLNPVFALQRHTTPTADAMVWGVIAYNTMPHLVLIHGTMTAQRYVHDILQPHFLQRLSGGIFQQDNARPPTAWISQECLRTVTTLPCLARSPDLSPIEHIFDHLGQRVRHLTS